MGEISQWFHRRWIKYFHTGNLWRFPPPSIRWERSFWFKLISHASGVPANNENWYLRRYSVFSRLPALTLALTLYLLFYFFPWPLVRVMLSYPASELSSRFRWGHIWNSHPLIIPPGPARYPLGFLMFYPNSVAHYWTRGAFLSFKAVSNRWTLRPWGWTGQTNEKRRRRDFMFD